MFSTMPSTGTLTRLNMAMPRRASIRARSCGRRDDDGALERHLLRHGELGVAGAGRHVDHHDVERAPLDLAQHLRQRRHHHRAAPDHRRLFLDQEADRHHLEAVAVHRDEHGCRRGLRPALDGRAASASTGRRCRHRAAPTLRPRSRRPSARLTAVVDLPTPPLPEATAMIAPTPAMAVGLGARAPAGPPRGAWGGARRGARFALGGERHHDRGHPGDRLDGRLRALAAPAPRPARPRHRR